MVKKNIMSDIQHYWTCKENFNNIYKRIKILDSLENDFNNYAVAILTEWDEFKHQWRTKVRVMEETF